MPGSSIAVLAISSPSTPDRIDVAMDRLRDRGFVVRCGSNLYDRVRGYLAGEDAARLDELNQALRSDADAIFFARGGYGAMRILDAVDYQAARRRPRPVVGYSDLTALHQALATQAGIGSFHGPMLNVDFFEGLSPEIDRWFWGCLAGESDLRFAFGPENVLVPGAAEGILFGGCLSLTVALMATPFDFWIDDGIWFWEDVSEPIYRIDRMLTHLRLSGRLHSVRGIMIGRLRDCGEGDEAAIRDLIADFFGNLSIPVAFDLPFGHFGDNLLLPIGSRVRLDTVDPSITLLEPVVSVA